MIFKIGDYVSRNSYENDVVFKIIDIKDDIAFLKGFDVRLVADSNINDLSLVDSNNLDIEINELESDRNEDDFFYLPAKILHIDGDEEYLNKCLEYYKKNKVLAYGFSFKEEDMFKYIGKYLNEFKPDILIITGHDAFNKKSGNKDDINNYKNTLNFIKTVKNARSYEKSHEKLLIIAGACQSNYEELIKAGADFASSPKRVNIHALDPAIIATSIALTEKNSEVDLIDLLEKTKNGPDGMGGLKVNGFMYVGYPR